MNKGILTDLGYCKRTFSCLLASMHALLGNK